MKLQKPKWKLAAMIVFTAVALAYLFFSDNGLLHYRQLKVGKLELEKRVFNLEQSKASLSDENTRLKTSTEMQEQVIREQTNMIRGDETVFVFPEEQSGEP